MNLMLQLLLGVLLLSCNGTKEKKVVHATFATTPPSHAVWNGLLQQHVNENGNVDYGGLKQDNAELGNYLNHLAQHPPSQTWSKNDSLAYYINLYNAATVKLIVDHYPVKSIKDIPNRWDKKWIQIGNTTVSLNAIEHEVLRKMHEPRIHFAINCASYSCPKLLNEAFVPERMEQLLQRAATDFINDSTKNRFGKDKAQLSKIFKWYKNDFTAASSLLEYINPYIKTPISTAADVDFLDYDWSLNDAK